MSTLCEYHSNALNYELCCVLDDFTPHRYLGIECLRKPETFSECKFFVELLNTFCVVKASLMKAVCFDDTEKKFYIYSKSEPRQHNVY